VGKAMDGPDRNARPAEAGSPEAVPGHFVSDEHRSDCARFLDEMRSRIDRRREADRNRPRLNPPQ
jgi:hypothetical protein